MMNSDISALRNKTVYIFGAGLAGSAALENLDESVEVKGFIDNDDTKIGTVISGYQVYGPEHLNTSSFDLVLIASEYFEQISKQLIKHFAVHPEKIIVLPARMLKSVSLGQSESIQNNALSVLFTVTKHLNASAVNYHVDAGTLLGIYRDGHLIPWDDDLDIAINASDIIGAKAAINIALRDLGQQFECQWELSEHCSEIDFGAVPKGAIRSFKLYPNTSSVELPMMDVFVKYIDGDKMDYTLASRGIRMPSEHLLTTVTTEFEGNTIRLPSDVDGYLTAHYGDWRTPIKDWNLSMLKNATVY